MKTKALIYLYRNWNCYRYHAYNDLGLPVVLSIANFRAYDTTTPVYVVDQSDVPMYWEDFPQKLNFKVMVQPASLRHLSQSVSLMNSATIYWSLLTKPFDVHHFAMQHPEDIFVATDVDIFFLQNPWPLENDTTNQFCCAENTGFYYFDKTDPITERVLEIWKGLCAATCFDSYTQSHMIDPKHCVIHDESVWAYVLRKYSKYLPITKLSYRENFRWRWLRDNTDPYELHTIKNLHLGDVIGRQYRGAGVMCVKEIRDAIMQVLSPEDLTRILGKFEGPVYNFSETKEHFEDIKKAIEDQRSELDYRHQWFATV